MEAVSHSSFHQADGDWEMIPAKAFGKRNAVKTAQSPLKTESTL